MGAPSKRAKRTRQATEFDIIRLAQALKPPRSYSLGGSWTVERIRAARDLQIVGDFCQPARLARWARSDDALFTALRNRLSPARSLPVELRAAGYDSSSPEPTSAVTARAERVRDEGDALFGPRGIAVKRTTCSDINEALANHGVAFGHNVWTPRPDGSRVDVEHRCWPIEHVKWNPSRCVYETRTAEGQMEDICHGDGRWTIYRLNDVEPWTWGAIVPGANIWMDRGFGVRDRGRASTSHGNAKVIGELPENVAIDSPEGQAFLLLLQTMHEALPYGIRPHGSKTEMLVNTSTSWQVFSDIIKERLSDAARVYLGHDGSIRAQGGNYIKDGYLFGVSADIVEADIRGIEDGIFEGVIQPWTAVNFGTSDLAPKRCYLLPDADEETLRSATAARRKLLFEDIKEAKAAGIVVDQEYVNARAHELGVDPPKLTATPLGTPDAEPQASPPPASPAPPDAPGPPNAAANRRSLRAIR